LGPQGDHVKRRREFFRHKNSIFEVGAKSDVEIDIKDSYFPIPEELELVQDCYKDWVSALLAMWDLKLGGIFLPINSMGRYKEFRNWEFKRRLTGSELRKLIYKDLDPRIIKFFINHIENEVFDLDKFLESFNFDKVKTKKLEIVDETELAKARFEEYKELVDSLRERMKYLVYEHDPLIFEIDQEIMKEESNTETKDIDSGSEIIIEQVSSFEDEPVIEEKRDEVEENFSHLFWKYQNNTSLDCVTETEYKAREAAMQYRLVNFSRVGFSGKVSTREDFESNETIYYDCIPPEFFHEFDELWSKIWIVEKEPSSDSEGGGGFFFDNPDWEET